MLFNNEKHKLYVPFISILNMLALETAMRNAIRFDCNGMKSDKLRKPINLILFELYYEQNNRVFPFFSLTI